MNIFDDAHILVVDDIELNVELMKSLLEMKGCRVSAAYSGAEAIELTSHEHFDLILLDIVMPEMNGFETCKIIKNQPSYKDVPIIFLSGKVDEASIEKGIDVGGQDFMTKPITEEDINVRIRSFVHISQKLKQLKQSPKTTITTSAPVSRQDASPETNLKFCHQLCDYASEIIKLNVHQTELGLLPQAYFQNLFEVISSIFNEIRGDNSANFSPPSLLEKLQNIEASKLNYQLDLAILHKKDISLKGNEELISIAFLLLFEQIHQNNNIDNKIKMKAICGHGKVAIEIKSMTSNISNFQDCMTEKNEITSDNYLAHIAMLILKIHSAQISINSPEEKIIIFKIIFNI